MRAITHHLSWILTLASCLLITLAFMLTACGKAGVVIPGAAGLDTRLLTHRQAAPVVDPQLSEAATPVPVYVPSVDADKVMSSPDYGMQVFLYWQAEIADRDLNLVRDAGFRWVKQEIPWREVEGHGKGSWQWDSSDRVMDQIEAHELKVIVRLGSQPAWAAPNIEFPNIGPPQHLQDFYDYVFAVANRYRGRVAAYQIWNEPNLTREWGGQAPNPAAYVEMLKVGYQAVKTADPQAIVISAGLAPTTRHDDQAMPDIYFFQGMYDAGAAPYFDSLGVHAAGYKSPPELDPAEVAADPTLTNGDTSPQQLRRAYAFRHVEDVRDLMVRNGDGGKKIVVLEVGWTIDPRPDSPYFWQAVTPEQQDKYLQRAYAYAEAHWQPWIGVMSLIYIAHPSWHWGHEETYWSIVYPGYPDLRTSPAYYGVLTMPKSPPVQ
jgi:hypothetical protein